MTAQELYDLAPLGAVILFSNGQPRPPERFKKKHREWQRHNATGFFKGCEPPSKWGPASFGLQTLTSNVITLTIGFSVTSKSDFVVSPRQVGTIVAYRKWLTDGRTEVEHVWLNVDVAQRWAQHNHYDLAKCGYEYFIVAEGDVLQPWTPEPVAAQTA